jgi:hypothetical protein
VLLSCAVLFVVRWKKESIAWDAAHMVAALPSQNATLVYADVETLRKAGVLERLAGSRSAEEADYRRFVEQIGFDYRTDLDAIAASFVSGDVYLTVRGRFQWTQLAEYAKSQRGECHYAVCSLPASAPGRRISFFPLHKDVLALAETSDRASVEVIAPGSVAKLPPLPPEPLWITIPSSVLAKAAALPVTARTIVTPLTRAEKVTIAAGAQDPLHTVLRLAVSCRTPNEAETIRSELYDATNALRAASANEKAPLGEPDWMAVLRGGTFVRNEAEVTGTWPLDRQFLDSLVTSETR